jgi:hypothetical protein
METMIMLSPLPVYNKQIITDVMWILKGIKDAAIKGENT